jgi:hypothetical protein
MRNDIRSAFSLSYPFALLLLLTLFSTCAYAAAYGKLDIQVPSPKCKIYVDDKLIGQGNKVVKLTAGTHKIKVLENGKTIFLKKQAVAANKYLAIKASPAKVEKKVVIDENLLAPMPQIEATPEAEPVTLAPTHEAAAPMALESIAEKPLAEEKAPEKPAPSEFNFKYFLLPQYVMDGVDFVGGVGLAAGFDCGFEKGWRSEMVLSLFSSTTKDRALSEGSFGMNDLDFGVLYKFAGETLLGFDLSGYYTGTGLSFYTFTHDPASSVIKAHLAANEDYEESIANGCGFYYKLGRRFTGYYGIQFDCGIRTAVVNTIASSTTTNKTTKIARDVSMPFSLPTYIFYIGAVF